MTKRLYRVATIGFLFAGLLWCYMAWTGGDKLYVVLGLSNLCLAATFFALGALTAAPGSNGTPSDQA